MSARRASADELVTVADRIRYMQICRLIMLIALPAVAMATYAPAPVVRRLALACAGWLVFVLATWVLVRAGRRAAVTTLTATLLGDGVVLVAGWYWLDGLDGPVGVLVLLHTIAVTLVASFRTGAKMALWHSLLALLILDAQAAGLLGPHRPFPGRDAAVYLCGLWVAALATAGLAAVNERELRRRRYDEKALLDLALTLGARERVAEVATTLAEFALAELAARRAAVLVRSAPDYVAQLGPAGLAATVEAGGPGRVFWLSPRTRPPSLVSDEVLLVHEPGATDAWLLDLLPGAANLIVIPFDATQTGGVLVIECAGRMPRRYTRRVERRLIATARQAAAQSAAAVGRAVAITKLAEAVNTDGLTGLANRAHFDTLLADRVAAGEPFAVILVDLDHFKAVNDTYGHQTGDAVLRGVAAALRQAAAPGDVVARYGGEELVVLSTGAAAEARDVAERLRRAVAAAATPVPVTASLGAACFPAEEITAGALVLAADRRLYVAKRSGRNRSVTSADDVLTTRPTTG